MGYRVAPAVLAAALLSVLIAPVAFAADLVPDVVGLELEKAQELLARAGYDATLDFDASKPAGIVFGQSPGGLAGRPKGTRVTLNVGGTAPAPDPVPEAPAPGPDLPPAGPAPVAPTPVDPRPADPRPADPTPTPSDDGLGTPPGGTLPRDPLDLGDPPTGTPGAPIVEPPAPRDPEPAAPRDPEPAAPRSPEPAPILPGPGTPPEPGPGVTPAPGPTTTGDARLDAMPFAPRLDRSGPEVPDVLGRTRAAALNALAGWMVREELTLSVPSLVGTIINQWPKPGMTLAPGEPVTMQVAVAQSPSINHRSVPVLIGKSVSEVEQTLQRFGFSGQFSKVLSRPARFAKGVWQQPMPGSLAPEGTVVVVNFGAGDGTPRPAAPSPTAPAPLPTDPMAPIAPSVPEDPTPLEPDAPPAGMPALPPLGDPPTGPEAKPPADLLPPAGPLPPAPGPQDPAPQDPAPRDPAPRDPAPRDPVPQDPAPRDPSGTQRPLARPKLISPPAGESYPRAYGATFEWSASSGATEYDWELEEEQPSGAWRKVDKANVPKSRYRPERMKRGRYRWRVRATAGDRTSDWSGWFRLYMY